MSKSICVMLLIFASVLTAADLPEKFAKRIDVAEERYKLALKRADEVRLDMLQRAELDRTRAFKIVLADANKAGDSTTAAEIKAKLVPLPSSGLAEFITDIEWKGRSDTVWASFTFKSGGVLLLPNSKARRAQWMQVDEDSVLAIHDQDQHFYVDRLVFSKDRSSVMLYYIGEMGQVGWEAKRPTATK